MHLPRPISGTLIARALANSLRPFNLKGQPLGKFTTVSSPLGRAHVDSIVEEFFFVNNFLFFLQSDHSHCPNTTHIALIAKLVENETKRELVERGDDSNA